MFFFFQAEDGIRDVAVTGVQTCALPIYTARIEALALGTDVSFTGPNDDPTVVLDGEPLGAAIRTPLVSELASRVAAIPEIGRASCRKECRSRWSPYHEKKKRKNNYSTQT